MEISGNSLAYFQGEIFRGQLHKFSQIYRLICLLEKSLQLVIPGLLFDYSQLQGLDHWYDSVTLSEKGKKSLKIAIRKAQELESRQRSIPLENLLPLSFWRYLVTQNNYATLWVPILFEAFPNLQQPKRLPSFKELDRRLGLAVKVRNQIAHFEFHDRQNLDISIRNLLWLLSMINGELHIIGEQLIADTSRHGPTQ